MYTKFNSALLCGRRGRIMLCLAAACHLGAQTAGAAESGVPAVGQQIARQWCASCHVVDAAQHHASATGAPPFSAIAAMPSTTPLSLDVFLQTQHERMPNFELTHTEIANLVAYIISLKAH